jgi:hypothetical protein
MYVPKVIDRAMYTELFRKVSNHSGSSIIPVRINIKIETGANAVYTYKIFS